MQAGEHSLGACQKPFGLLLARLQGLVHETSAIINLTKADLNTAGYFILKMAGLTEKHPSLRDQLESSIHLLAGNYLFTKRISHAPPSWLK